MKCCAHAAMSLGVSIAPVCRRVPGAPSLPFLRMLQIDMAPQVDKLYRRTHDGSGAVVLIRWHALSDRAHLGWAQQKVTGNHQDDRERQKLLAIDRKSTRLNSSHSQISYAVFCLKK